MRYTPFSHWQSEVLFCSVHRYDRGKYYPTGPLGNFTSHGVGAGRPLPFVSSKCIVRHCFAVHDCFDILRFDWLAGEGYTVNVPWEVEKSKTPPGDAEFLYAFDRLFLPILGPPLLLPSLFNLNMAFALNRPISIRIAQAFEPDLVLVSAGFDAAPGDPLGWGHSMARHT